MDIVKEGKDACRPDGPVEKKVTFKTNYQHQKILNQFLSTITLCPMDAELKQILRMRIWGRHPAIFAPMSHADIAAELKTLEVNVKRWEEDALWNMEQYLKRTGGVQSIVEKFIQEGNLKKVMGEKTKIITSV